MDLTKPEIDFAGLAAALARSGPTLLDVIVDGSAG